MEEDKIFILRNKSKAYEMRNVKLNGEEISCNLQNLSGLKLKSNTRGEISYHYRPGRPDSTIRKQVHVFIPNQIINETDNSITIPINSIYKVEELKFDKAKTTREHVGAAVSITLGVALMLAIIASSISFTWGMAP